MQAYEVRWCAFPYSEAPGQPGPKARPATIMAVQLSANVVRAVYGTSRIRIVQPWHLVVTPAELPGLNVATKFDFTRMVTLPVGAAYFPAKGGDNLIGSLSANLQKAAIACFVAGIAERRRRAASRRHSPKV